MSLSVLRIVKNTTGIEGKLEVMKSEREKCHDDRSC